jgi:hypothetical protein
VTGGGRSGGGGGGGGQGSGGGRTTRYSAGAAVFFYSRDAWARRRPGVRTEAFPYIYTSVAGNRSAWDASVSKAESRGPNLIKPGVLQGVGAWIFISLPADTDRQCESPKCLASDVAAAGTRAPSVPARPPVNLAANGKIDREKKEGSRAVDKGSVLDPCMTKRTGVRARFLFFVHTR